MDADEALRRLRDWLRAGEFGPDGRLPPERALAPRLGVSRAELRSALAVVTGEGTLTRHVGRGTFLTDPPAPAAVRADPGDGRNAAADAASPRAVLEARLALEPGLAALAVLNATGRDLETLAAARRDVEAAPTWPAYDAADRRFHRAIAAAAGNAVLLRLHDVLAETSRRLDWGRLGERAARPAAEHPSHAEHEAIVTAIAARDRHAATDALRHHLLVEATALLGQSV